LNQVALLLGQFLEQLRHLAVGEQLRHIGFEQLGEVGSTATVRGVDDGIALDRRLLLGSWRRSR